MNWEYIDPNVKVIFMLIRILNQRKLCKFNEKQNFNLMKLKGRCNMTYYIIKVCPGKSSIKKVRLSNGTTWTKQKVVTTIKAGNEVKTKASNGTKAKVRTFRRKGVDYIRSVRDDTPVDNLGNLPKFSC